MRVWRLCAVNSVRFSHGLWAGGKGVSFHVSCGRPGTAELHQSVVFHIKNYVKVEMSPSLGRKNCSLTRNGLFPISRLLMSEKIYVAYAQERHASDFYLYFLKTQSGLELSRLFSINAVSLLSRASKAQAEERRLGSLPHLCFQSPTNMRMNSSHQTYLGFLSLI